MFPEAWRRLELAEELSASATAPANIAWIKYWGKKGHQLPANPSLSMTLSVSRTLTDVTIAPGEELTVELWFEGSRLEAFEARTHKFLQSLVGELPWLARARLKINSQNSFPHSSGIASSASSQAALALALGKIVSEASGSAVDLAMVGSLARLGSGSACRSLYGQFVGWGETPLWPGASDLHATPLPGEIHARFQVVRDAILIVSSQEKEVSSRAGHNQMQLHPFTQARGLQVEGHLLELLAAFKSGDWSKAGDVLEAEALTLHALMMTSRPGYVLLAPGSLEIIRLVRLFRRESHIPLYFTIDAGPNIHLIYPDEAHAKVETFVRHELLRFTENGNGVIWDMMGEGAK